MLQILLTLLVGRLSLTPQQRRSAGSAALGLGGLASLCTAGFLVSPILGFVVVGVALLLLEMKLDPDRVKQGLPR